MTCLKRVTHGLIWRKYKEKRGEGISQEKTSNL